MVKAKKKSKVANKVASNHSRLKKHHDQSSFLMIVAGGFLLIILITLSLGLFGTNRIKHTVHAQDEEKMSKETIITIQNDTFTSPVTVQKGTKVTWLNDDASAHTVVADDGSFDLGSISKDQTKSYVFETSGTFKYHSSINPEMEGTIIVE